MDLQFYILDLFMKIIAIDAIDINSFGGLVHLEQITKVLSQKIIHKSLF